MSLPSIVSYGAAAKTSSLVWDGDLVIPDGYAIESASGEVGIVGDVSVSGSLNTDGGISSGENVTAAENLVGVKAVLSDKPLIIGENIGDASVTLAAFTGDFGEDYTSSDFAITGIVENVVYKIPPITVTFSGRGNGSFMVDAKLSKGTYQLVTQIPINSSGYENDVITPAAVLPMDATALRYRFDMRSTDLKGIITSTPLTLTPYPVY